MVSAGFGYACGVFPPDTAMRRADRLFQIVLLLGRRHAVTASELAEALEVSERTLYRDIADLSLSGVPVEGEAGVGYLMRGHYQIPPLMFDPEEVAALVLGARMARGWTDPELGRVAERALLKIEAVLPEQLKARISRQPLLVPDFHVPEAMIAHMADLRRAIADQRKLAFDYVRADGQPSRRTVWPLGLFFWGETWTLGAWCELRGEFRSFRLDRMAALAMLDELVEGDARDLLEDYIRAVSGTA
jgi:predicted DNA-binding transcriptional regulator YafY